MSPLLAAAAVGCSLLTALGARASIIAGEPALADPSTGQTVRNHPPAQRFDHQHVRIELDLTTWPPATIPATTTLTLEAIGTSRRLIELDAKGIAIHGVRLRGQDVAFTAQNDVLSVRSPEPLVPGRPFDLAISYTITNLEPDGIGLSLYPSDLGEGRYVLSSQGQTDHNSRWFPHRDAPDDPATTELIVRTATPDLQVLGTGVRRGPRIGRDGIATHTATLNPEHPLYLTAVTVGQWLTATLPDPAGTLPMRVYTERPLSDADRVVLEQTGPMLRYFELIFDEPYAWATYDQVFLPGVTWSMEHTSLSFMDADMLGNPIRTQDTVAHELAHHWFGNLVTCRDWSQLWLNEGMASYCELLWAEQEARRHRQTPDAARARVLAEWRSDLFRDGSLGFPGRLAIANHRFLEADDQFALPDSPYSKGAYIIHMLREHLGDPVFFRALASYIDEHKHGSVTTADFRRAFEVASGLSLERFFDQWTARGGYPVVSAITRADRGTVVVQLEQRQTIDADNPAYELRIPVVFTNTTEQQSTQFVQFDTRSAEVTLMLPFPSDQMAGIAIDPDRSLLMDLTVLPDTTQMDAGSMDSETP